MAAVVKPVVYRRIVLRVEVDGVPVVRSTCRCLRKRRTATTRLLVFTAGRQLAKRNVQDPCSAQFDRRGRRYEIGEVIDCVVRQVHCIAASKKISRSPPVDVSPPPYRQLRNPRVVVPGQPAPSVVGEPVGDAAIAVSAPDQRVSTDVASSASKWWGKTAPSGGRAETAGGGERVAGRREPPGPSKDCMACRREQR